MASHGSIRILLIEDNPDDVRLLRAYLTETRTCRVEVAHERRLSAGLNRLTEQNFDAVLLDLALPDSQGLDTVIRVRAAAKRIPLIVLTEIEDEVPAVRLAQAGVQDYLVKGRMSGPLLTRSLRYAVELGRMEEAVGEVERRFHQLEADQKHVLELIAKDAPLSAVFDALIRMIEEQSAARMVASILLMDADGIHLRSGAAPSLPEAYNRAIDGMAIGPHAGSCGTAAYRRRPVYVSDIANDPLWANFAPLALTYNLRACWSTPILSSSDRLLGTFAMYYPDVREPNGQDLRLVDTATRLAAIAIERTRAEEVLRRTKFSVDRAADAVYWVDSQAKILDVNEAASRMLSYSKDELCAMTIHDLNPDFQAGMWPGFWAETQRRGTVMFETVHQAKDGRLIPIEMSVNCFIHEGTEYHCAFVRDITERKRAEGQFREMLDRIRKLSQRLEAVREEERTRIAHELHDELGVRLTCFRLDLARLRSFMSWSPIPREEIEKKIHSMNAEVDATIASVQRLVAELRPGILDDLGLAAAVEWQCQDLERRSGIRCSCEAAEEHIPLPTPLVTAAFRICQEALTNVVRHAEATAVRVRIKQVDGLLQLEVDDDGIGISPDKLSDSRSFGLLGMRERAASLGGQIEIAGRPEKGTTVTLQLPLNMESRR